MGKKIITWVEGLKGVSGVVIVFNHLRMCFWPESHDAVPGDGQHYIVALPFLGLICAGNLAVRLYFVLSGFSLAYRPLQLLEEQRNGMVYQRTSVALQARFWRLLVPSGLAAGVSLVISHLGAFSHSKTVCRAFNDTTPTPGNLVADLWLWTKDTFVDMWVTGKHNFHDSLWCMKILLLGSYIMYMLTVLRAEARHSQWLWLLIGGALMTPSVSQIGATDLAGFVFGGIIANMEINIGIAHDNQQDKAHSSSWQLLHQLGWSALFVFFLFLGSYPSGDANAPWCEWMYMIARYVVGIESPRLAMIWWMNVAAFLICIGIVHLPLVQKLLSLQFLQYLGKTSFALFLLHPLILRSLGGHLFSIFNQWQGFGYDVAALVMVAVVLVFSLVASHAWFLYVEGRAHKLVERYLIIVPEAGPSLVK